MNEPEHRLRAVALCDNLGKVLAFHNDFRPPIGVDLYFLTAPNDQMERREFLRHLIWYWLRGCGISSRLAIVRLLLRRRLRITLGTIHERPALRWLKGLGADVGLHGAGVIYRSTVIDAFRHGILNPHIGLLPSYRGRSVMEWSLLNGDRTGVSTFFLDEGIDTGPEIVVCEEVEISGCESVREAKGYLFSLDMEMFRKALIRLTGPDYRPQFQDVSLGRRFYVMSSLLTGVANSLLQERMGKGTAG